MGRRLELRALRAFAAVAEEGSIRRAAERLHVSQPPLSRAIRELEELLGGNLFVRSAAGVAPTPLARRLLPRAQRLLHDADGFLEEARRTSGRSFRVGVSLGLPPAKARRVAAALVKAAGRGPAEVHSDFSPALARSLRAGELDFALLSLPGDTRELEVVPLASQALVVALPARHPAARKRIVSLRHLEGARLFWHARSVNPAFHDACERAFRAAGYRPRYETVPPGYLMTLDRIAQGEGFTLVNEWRARTRVAGLAYRRLAEDAELRIVVAAAWAQRDPPPDRARWVAAARRALS